MGDPFTLVVVGAMALFALMGILSPLTGGSLYDKIGEGWLSMGEGKPSAPSEPPPDSPSERAEREIEIRQMLQARSERLVRQGKEPLDVDAELARLDRQEAESSPHGGNDAALVEEVRQLVVARNERRARNGEEPLDVETEVQRTLAELNPDGR